MFRPLKHCRASSILQLKAARTLWNFATVDASIAPSDKISLCALKLSLSPAVADDTDGW
jgi:hypothetical protein